MRAENVRKNPFKIEITTQRLNMLSINVILWYCETDSKSIKFSLQSLIVACYTIMIFFIYLFIYLFSFVINIINAKEQIKFLVYSLWQT